MLGSEKYCEKRYLGKGIWLIDLDEELFLKFFVMGYIRVEILDIGRIASCGNLGELYFK